MWSRCYFFSLLCLLHLFFFSDYPHWIVQRPNRPTALLHTAPMLNRKQLFAQTPKLFNPNRKPLQINRTINLKLAVSLHRRQRAWSQWKSWKNYRILPKSIVWRAIINRAWDRPIRQFVEKLHWRKSKRSLKRRKMTKNFCRRSYRYNQLTKK